MRVSARRPEPRGAQTAAALGSGFPGLSIDGHTFAAFGIKGVEGEVDQLSSMRDLLVWPDKGGLGLPGDTGDEEPACQCRRYERCGFDPWAGKIPWRRV